MSQIVCWKKIGDHNLTGYTLIVPSVAVGNVAQLSCDLLISTLKMKKVACLYSLAFIPVLGYDPYNLNSNDLAGCCELYQCEEKKLLVLQIRSPIILRYARLFLQEIVTSFKDHEISNIIVLTSSYAHEKKHIMTSPFRYIADETSPYLNTMRNKNWIQHESLDGTLKIHGGGFASVLYEISTQSLMPCTILYKYCSEGDNTLDAYDMIQYLTSILEVLNENVSQLVEPVSWKFLFGKPPPLDIY